MTLRDAAGLLHLAGSDELKLFELGRFEKICGELPSPATQIPRVLQLLGRKQKDIALKCMLPHNTFGNTRKPRSLANLHVDNSSLKQNDPLLVIEGDLLCPPTQTFAIADHGYATGHAIPWQRDECCEELNSLLHSRLLFLFVDTVCLFVDDFEAASLERVLRRWFSAGVTYTACAKAKPSLLLISAEALPSYISEIMSSFNGSFGAFSCVGHQQAGADQVSALSRFLPLKKSLWMRLSESHRLRQQAFAGFSAKHLQGLFKEAVVHFCKSLTAPFDFFTATQPKNLDSRITQHLGQFLSLARRNCLAYHDIVAFISTALSMDAYPPLMHGKYSSWKSSALMHDSVRPNGGLQCQVSDSLCQCASVP